MAFQYKNEKIEKMTQFGVGREYDHIQFQTYFLIPQQLTAQKKPQESHVFDLTQFLRLSRQMSKYITSSCAFSSITCQST